MAYGRGFSYTGNDELPGLSRRYVPGSAGERGSDLNSTIRDFNEADRAAADARLAPSNTIAARFNPLEEGSAFRRSNPVGWEALNQKYGQPDIPAGAENFDAQKFHDDAMAPSKPIEDYAAMFGYGPGYEQAMKNHQAGQGLQLYSNPSGGMARAPMPSYGALPQAGTSGSASWSGPNGSGSFGSQPQPDTSYSIDKLTGVASGTSQPKPLVNPSTPGLGDRIRNNPFLSTINSFLGIDK